MSENMTGNMTEGSPLKHILRFVIPLLLGGLFQQLYSMVDTMIVGRTLGSSALAAVGSTGAINFMVIGFCIGICSGFAIPIANAFGAGDEEALKKYVGNSIWVSTFFGVVMTVIVSVFCMDILEAMNTPASIIEQAHDYIFVIFVGIPVIILYNLASGFMRAIGDSKTPLYFLIVASILNIVLDFVTILVFDMGVAGAAVATVVSQGVAGILCIIYIVKKCEILKPEKVHLKPEKHYIRQLCIMGVPMGLQYSITAIGSVILQTAINGLGAIAVASVTAGGRIIMILCAPLEALGATMATYAGQNVGARKVERVQKGVNVSLIMGSIYGVIGWVVIYLFGTFFIQMFIDLSEVEVISLATTYLRFTAACLIPLTFLCVLRFTIQGMGFANLAIFAGVFEMVARIIVAVILVPKFGFVGASLSNPLAWILGDLFLIPAYIYTVRVLKKRMAGESFQGVQEEIAFDS